MEELAALAEMVAAGVINCVGLIFDIFTWAVTSLVTTDGKDSNGNSQS